ncbi:glycosyltransferase family 2 protein [Raineya orbicola]|jgi:glycosyltransferase involved in cell wall biosynthesis|uniref:Glycosyl transferase family 2 n=1 Tax=Raineya orbicola TaxID=2016530 RepID=A0A2N3IKV9_9BACT|nr:glycosyltransferase family A protein [Raineya orbicola]PKQ70934.1 Glycosyl transferase family 2 [Raineya orbicola]
MNSPLFSIVIPTYNRADFIKQTLQSVIHQKFTDFEVIVVDDGSTDNTEEVVKPFLSEKLRYYKVPNGERAKARNFGITQAKGKYITFVDSDDLLYPNYFQIAYDFLQKKPDSVFWALSYEMKDEKGNILFKQIHRGDIAQKLQFGNILSCIGVFVKKEILLENPFNENRDLSGTEDYELWLRLASRYPLQGISTICASMINHNSRSVLSISTEKLIKRIKSLLQNTSGDEKIKNFYGSKGIANIEAHSYLYIALHLVMAKKRIETLHYLFKSLKIKPSVISTYKFWVIVKKWFWGS